MEYRTLPRDHTFSYEKYLWQVLPSDDVLALSGKKIEVRKTLQQQIQAWYGPYRLSIRPAPQTPPRSRGPFVYAGRVKRAAKPDPVRGRVHL